MSASASRGIERLWDERTFTRCSRAPGVGPGLRISEVDADGGSVVEWLPGAGRQTGRTLELERTMAYRYCPPTALDFDYVPPARTKM
jgi:hypothetical protein